MAQTGGLHAHPYLPRTRGVYPQPLQLWQFVALPQDQSIAFDRRHCVVPSSAHNQSGPQNLWNP